MKNSNHMSLHEDLDINIPLGCRILIFGSQGNLCSVLHDKITNLGIPAFKTNDPDTFQTILLTNPGLYVIYTSYAKYPYPESSGSQVFLKPYIHDSINLLTETLGIISSNPRNISKFIYCSSSAVYGAAFPSEDSHPVPGNIYATTKLLCENLVSTSLAPHTPFLNARIFNTYGGQDRFSIVAKILNTSRVGSPLTIANAGSGIRDFVHVNDVVITLLMLLFTNTASNSTVNISTGHGISIQQLLQAASESSGRPLNITPISNPTEVPESVGDTRLLESLIPFTPQQRVIEYIYEKTNS